MEGLFPGVRKRFLCLGTPPGGHCQTLHMYFLWIHHLDCFLNDLSANLFLLCAWEHDTVHILRTLCTPVDFSFSEKKRVVLYNNTIKSLWIELFLTAAINLRWRTARSFLFQEGLSI